MRTDLVSGSGQDTDKGAGKGARPWELSRGPGSLCGSKSEDSDIVHRILCHRCEWGRWEHRRRSTPLQPSGPPFRTGIRALDVMGTRWTPASWTDGGSTRGDGEGRAVGVEDGEQFRDSAIHQLPAG